MEKFFDLLETQLWDRRHRHSFATYTIGLMSESLQRKSQEPIAASFTNAPPGVRAAARPLAERGGRRPLARSFGTLARYPLCVVSDAPARSGRVLDLR